MQCTKTTVLYRPFRVEDLRCRIRGIRIVKEWSTLYHKPLMCLKNTEYTNGTVGNTARDSTYGTVESFARSRIRGSQRPRGSSGAPCTRPRTRGVRAWPTLQGMKSARMCKGASSFCLAQALPGTLAGWRSPSLSQNLPLRC